MTFSSCNLLHFIESGSLEKHIEAFTGCFEVVDFLALHFFPALWDPWGGVLQLSSVGVGGCQFCPPQTSACCLGRSCVRTWARGVP